MVICMKRFITPKMFMVIVIGRVSIKCINASHRIFSTEKIH